MRMTEDIDDVVIIIRQVPTRHTIYTPKDVLHTNNYLQGTWRTMLADGKVNEGKLLRNNKMLRFTFEK